jgi:CheY-like chemotaxis protein
LVVDDEITIRSLLDTALTREGYPVWLASDGEQALEVFRIHRNEIALVFLDVRMPVLDGPETLKALQRLEPAIRCCFMSGQSGQYSAEQLLELGAAQVFKKPFRIAEVLEAAERLTAEVPPKKG